MLTLVADPVRIVFDTDMIGDYDDVGAMAVLHKLADAGECEILATVSSTHSNASVGTIEILNRYYGRPDIPVGAAKGDGVGGGSENPRHRSHAKYEWLLKRYPGWWKYRNADDALAQLTANHVPYDETELKIFEKAVRTGDAKKWWSLKTTHMFAAYWRARLRGLIRAND